LLWFHIFSLHVHFIKLHRNFISIACNLFYSLFDIVGGGVQLGPLGIAATNRPMVPAPGDYDDGEIGGMMIGRGK
jgi:hypothetical protein